MKMRKFLALMLVFAMAFTAIALSSCGGGEDDDEVAHQNEQHDCRDKAHPAPKGYAEGFLLPKGSEGFFHRER